jgi:uncharacterized protein YndB with AHSA1/START domain
MATAVMATEPALGKRPSLTLRRTYAVSPDKVWRAWTDPQALKLWFKPDGFSVLAAEADVRIGGRFRVLMKDPEGREYDVGGVYRDLVSGRRLVMTWNWKDQPGEESLLTVTLRPSRTGTELELRHEGYLDREPPVKTHEEGALDQLAALLLG